MCIKVLSLSFEEQLKLYSPSLAYHLVEGIHDINISAFFDHYSTEISNLFRSHANACTPAVPRPMVSLIMT